ncbi:MAG: hypothetical protein MOGMAGMI_00281 [Candidatus Omnitrophica bacterium]|nr:hypothetical protein [Candidatus Omnitrophota bacterium]
MISFNLPDLIVESVIRDGLAVLNKNPDLIDDIFKSLTANYNVRKYGSSEINKIKTLIQSKQIKVVHSFNQTVANLPCFSIQLGADIEDRRLAHLEDFVKDDTRSITDPDALDDLVILSNIIATSYNPLTGQLFVDDSTDLTEIHRNQLFVDASGNEFLTKSGVSTELGNKFITLDKNIEEIDLSDFCLIKSILDYTQFEVNSVFGDVQVLVGVHTKDALLTKYLYILLKYILLSRKKDLIKRCFIVSSWSGSDFTRDFQWEGDMVFTRFLTISGKVEDSWVGDDVELFDDVEITTTPVDC